jgi:hypothetical protein
LVKRLQKEYQGGEKASRRCPLCQSRKICKDGKIKITNDFNQRFICSEKNYKHRFNESSVLSRGLNNSGKRQVGATLMEAKITAQKNFEENTITSDVLLFSRIVSRKSL